MSSRLLVSLVGGVLVALSLPPWGWWPLAWVGVGLLAWALDGLGWRRRVLAGGAYGVGQFVIGLWWMLEFNSIGGVLVMILETLFMMAAAWSVPGLKRGGFLLTPAALVVAEFARGEVPFEGLPMAGIALGQVTGPLSGSARLGGALLVLGLAACVGTGFAAVARGRGRIGWALMVLAAAGGVLGWAAPDGGPTRDTLRIAVVQGGGPRGFRGVESDPAEVFYRHLDATELVRPPVDLVMWPEDVVDTEVPIREFEGEAALAAVAIGAKAPLIAGIVEDAGPKHFRNASVLWEPDGRLAGRYDKNHRVPFGEYVPGRSFVDNFADLSVIPRDAIPGTRAGILRPASTGPIGVVISFEVYFADRARAAVKAGGRVLLVPTNAASFTTSQVPTTEVAAAQLRAIETGRDLAQAAPTGYGALIDNNGRVLSRTTLGRRQVLHGEMRARTGQTVYTRIGDWPVLALTLLALSAFWARLPRHSEVTVPSTERPADPADPSEL